MRRTRLASACVRRSVEVSTRIERTAAANGDCRCAGAPASGTISIRIDGRDRLSRGSLDRHTSQSQPIAGTPWEVPLPSTVTRRAEGLGLNDPTATTGRLDEAQPELVEHLVEDFALFGGEVAAGLLFHQGED